MDGDYLVLVLGGQGGVSAIRFNQPEVAEQVTERLNQIQGYSAAMFYDNVPKPGGGPTTETEGDANVVHHGLMRGGLGPNTPRRGGILQTKADFE